MLKFLRHLLLPHESNNQRARLLHPSSWTLLIVGLISFQALIGFTAKTYPHILGYASQIPPAEIIRLSNEQRKNQGLAELKYDSQLSAAAAQKAADMFARDYWAHVSPVGTQPWYFVTQSGYNYRYAGENLARDFSDPGAVVQAWINSPSHKENLLNNRYQDMGVAVVDGTLEGRETTLVVQMFGTKLSAAAPSVAKTGLNIAVKAAETTPLPVVPTLEPTATPSPSPEVTPAPMIMAGARPASPFTLTKVVSLGVLAIIILVLVTDIIAVRKQRIVRWTSRSLAHLAFMVFLLIAATVIYTGQIL